MFHLGGSSCALAEPKPTACGHSGSNLGVRAFIIGLRCYRRAQKPPNGELKPDPVFVRRGKTNGCKEQEGHGQRASNL